ncbi:MAG: hypothetical protein MUC48_18495, partial [Leptolyngbya sp. Prado105]|nr:hypothetical protein [Leptolyngbya sp. Prado105]
MSRQHDRKRHEANQGDDRVKLLRLARDLKRRKARERRGHFVAEGVRAVEALLASPLRIEGVLVAPALAHTARGEALAAAARARCPV